MKTPRVVMVISFFYPALGGAEQQALRLAELLIQKGIDVKVLTRWFPDRAAFEMVGSVPVYREIKTFSWGKLFAVSYFVSCLWFLFRHRNTYDIIHCHILHGLHSFAAIVLKRFFHKKVIIKVAMAGGINDFSLLKKIAFGSILLKQIHNIDCLVTLCRQSTREAFLEGFSPSATLQIPNGVDIDLFKPQGQVVKDENKIIFVGALDPRKNIPLLIAAVQKLKARGIRVALDIIGEGPERPQLTALVNDCDISDQIHFLGPISSIAQHILRAHIFILPSAYEGLPNVVLEAMACGVPVIATNVGGVPDIIQHGKNGLIIAPGDSAALCAGIQGLLGDKKLCQALGARARQTVVEQFSLSSVAGRYGELYKNLVAGKAIHSRL